MKKITLKNTLLLFVLGGFLSLNAFAQSVYSVHSSACEAVNPSALHKVKIEDLGLTNFSPPASVWVTCPIALEVFDSSQQSSSFAVVIGNLDSAPITAPCIFRGVDGEAGDTIQRSQRLTIAPGDIGEYEWEVDDTMLLWPTLTCKIPPGAVLGPIVYGTGVF